jgi:hypothetical protein
VRLYSFSLVLTLDLAKGTKGKIRIKILNRCNQGLEERFMSVGCFRAKPGFRHFRGVDRFWGVWFA